MRDFYPSIPTKILVVEDEKEINDLITYILKKANFEVISYFSALQAIDFLDFNSVDMIISDVMMPKMDGIEFCKILKQKLPEVYFILLTAKSEQKDKIIGLEAGADDYIVKPFDVNEFIARVKAGERIIKSQKELYILNKQLEQLVIQDNLTCIYNRRYFDNKIIQEIERSKRYNHETSLLFIDLDHFKRINDTYGHQAGDFVLASFAKILSTSLRVTDIFCRYGGEEFAIILPETNIKDAFNVAEKLRTLVEESIIRYENSDLKLTISIGIASIKGDSAFNESDLIDRADKALYKAKNSSRNCSVVDDTE